jgi:hypothetical protein
MTQYGVRIQFNDDEIHTLMRALDSYLAQQKEVDSALKFFDTHIREELRDNARMLKTCSFLENEFVVIEQALDIYSQICNREISNGVTVPFSADRTLIKQISERLLNESLRAVIEAEIEWARGPTSDR